MGSGKPQLEFRWTSWLRVFPQPVAPKSKPLREDEGLTGWCTVTAAHLQLPELARRVRVVWNPRMQTTAGRAWWPDRVIELNPKLGECDPDQLWRTLKHELAHLVAFERCGRRRIAPHGPEWQAACAELGIPGEQPFHSLPFKRRRMKRKHAYICPACFTTIHRVKPFRHAVACYECCRRYAKGGYHDRFRLIRQDNLPAGIAALAAHDGKRK